MDNTDLSAKLKNSAPGQTSESTNSKTDTGGLYRHPVSGQEMITLSDPLYGDAQSEAAIRVGFVRVGDTPTGAVKYVGQIDTSAVPSGQTDEMKGLLARLKVLEADKAPGAPVEETPVVKTAEVKNK